MRLSSPTVVSPTATRFARQYEPKPRHPLRALALMWLWWLAAVLTLGLLNSASGSPALAAEVIILLHAGLTVLILARCHDTTTATIIGLSLLLRTGLVFWDLNFSHILQLPNSGGDTESYYYWAVQVSQDPSLLFEEIRGEVYSKLVGMLFWLIGPVRSFGQYTNVLFSVSAVLLMTDVLERLSLSDSRRVRILAIISLLPNTLVLSAIFLRESLISFLIAVSVYFFVRWFEGGNALSVLAVVGAVMAASTLHAGVIAVGIGYAMVIPFYRPKEARFGFSLQGLFYLGFFAAIMYFAVAQYPDMFLGKFEAFDTENDLLRVTNYRGGESQYLSDLTVDSYADLLRVGPLRALYFLGSPMPWDFRGLLDMFTFVADSLFYLGVPILFLVIQHRIPPRWRALGYALLVVLCVSSLLFGAGVSNAGTAARHRIKLVSIVMALLIVSGTAMRRRTKLERKGPSESGKASILATATPGSSSPPPGSTSSEEWDSA